MTSQVKLPTSRPSLFDPRGHGFPLRLKRNWLASGRPADLGTSDGRERHAPAQTLADRYVDVWNERDDESRRVAIAALWVPDGQHYVEGREARGYEALEKRIRGSHEKNVRDDGNRFRAAKDVRRLRDVVTFHWDMLPADSETILATGREFLIIADDGRVLADY